MTQSKIHLTPPPPLSISWVEIHPHSPSQLYQWLHLPPKHNGRYRLFNCAAASREATSRRRVNVQRKFLFSVDFTHKEPKNVRDGRSFVLTDVVSQPIRNEDLQLRFEKMDGPSGTFLWLRILSLGFTVSVVPVWCAVLLTNYKLKVWISA